MAKNISLLIETTYRFHNLVIFLAAHSLLMEDLHLRQMPLVT